MSEPYLAPSLDTFRNEIGEVFPDHLTIGWMAAPTHPKPSDHWPNERGSVNAIDVPSENVDVDAIIAAAIKHPSTWYVISRGKIYSSTYGFAERDYDGSNPHDSHTHISIHSTVEAEQNTSSWGLEGEMALTNEEIEKIAKAVWAVGLNVVGKDGPQTAGAVQGWTYNEVVRANNGIAFVNNNVWKAIADARVDDTNYNTIANIVADAIKPLIDSPDNDLTADNVLDALRDRLND